MANPAVQRARFLAPGDKLGKHDLIRQIAVGGMAELYLARTMGIEGFEKLVVLKRILPQYAGNTSFVNMFLNEARLAATFHHPNIAQVYDIDQDGGDYFFSMEYVHGQDLGHLVASAHESGVPLSLDAALTLVAGLCAGLHYAHEKAGPDGRPLNVVHRDVSPSNVLVSYDGAVKLVDFGIARAGSNPSTTKGGLKGKIAYMSPEQCRGKVTLDRRSDVFSIGTILYELTAGRLPFTDETEYGVLNQIVNRDAEPPSRIVAGYAPALEAIVMRALARDPDQRYATALEMQKDVEDFAHENRLRVSPLVLARLMGTLYPTRLEEWDHARAQGAFFVEQHVVRTLIESGKSTESQPVGVGGTVEDATADNSDTVVGPLPTDDATNVRTNARARTPYPLPGMPPPAQPAQRPSQPAMGPPRRPSEPTVRASSPVVRASSPSLPRAATPLPAMVTEPVPTLQPPPRFATPVPGRMPSPVLVPDQPGAVPIVGPVGGPPMDGAPMGGMPMGGMPMGGPPMGPTPVPAFGTMVSSQLPPDAGGVPMYPVAGTVDVTERVRVRPPMASVETTLVKIGKSRSPLIILAVTGVLAAAVAGVIVFSGSEEDVPAPAAGRQDPPRPEPAEGQAADPAKPAEDTAKAKVAEPAQPDPAGDPAKAKAAEDAAKAKAAEDAKTDAAAKAGPDKAGEQAAQDPKTAKKPPKVVRQPPRVRPPRTAPKKDAKTKPETEKDPKWKSDSPFMPVRTDGK